MAKIFSMALCIFLLCNCNYNRVPDSSLATPQVEEYTKDAINDVPVNVDTTTLSADVDSIIFTTNDTADLNNLNTSERIREIYTSFIGVRELTGNNDGKEVEMFLSCVGLEKGYAWCAAFVKYCLVQAGVKDAARINAMALSCENKKYMIMKDGDLLEEPQTGDVGTLYYPSLKRIGHTFFYDHRVSAKTYESVEGNTNVSGGREGDGVYRKKRSYNATHSFSRWR